jgi:hypothetical protein
LYEHRIQFAECPFIGHPTTVGNIPLHPVTNRDVANNSAEGRRLNMLTNRMILETNQVHHGESSRK